MIILYIINSLVYLAGPAMHHQRSFRWPKVLSIDLRFKDGMFADGYRFASRGTWCWLLPVRHSRDMMPTVTGSPLAGHDADGYRFATRGTWCRRLPVRHSRDMMPTGYFTDDLQHIVYQSYVLLFVLLYYNDINLDRTFTYLLSADIIDFTCYFMTCI